MGEVISLDQRRAARPARTQDAGPRRRGPRPAVSFAFDLASPWTYLAAERVDRAFPAAVWQPVAADALRGAGEYAEDHDLVEARATELGMPLVWPERPGAGGRVATRVAAWAAERGQASAFVLAASRLTFCGGFDLEDPEILAEAAAAAGLPLDDCLAAAGDPARDASLAAAGRKLQAQGADRLPAVRVGRLLFSGEERLADAMAALRDPHAERRHRTPEGWAG